MSDAKYTSREVASAAGNGVVKAGLLAAFVSPVLGLWWLVAEAAVITGQVVYRNNSAVRATVQNVYKL